MLMCSFYSSRKAKKQEKQSFILSCKDKNIDTLSSRKLIVSFVQICLGVSAGKYVTQLRINSSIKLLIKPDLTIAEVAHSSGFYDQAQYCRAFKSTMKVIHSAYRKTFLPKLDSPEKS